MTVRVRVDIDGTTYDDAQNIRMEAKRDAFNSVSTIKLSLDNLNGQYSDNVTVGDTIDVWADKDATPTTRIGTFLCTDVDYTGEETGNNEEIAVSGEDYGMAIFKETNVEPEVYTNTEVSAIVNDLFDKYATGGLTRTGVIATAVTLTHIRFRNVSLFDAIKQLAELGESYFYFSNKDLQFVRNGSSSSGLTFNNTNVLTTKFRNSRKDLINKLWVYGGTHLTGRNETFQTDGAGSVFTLVREPHNTAVTSFGSIKKGGVFQMSAIPASGQEYLVDFNGKKIIFTSGTAAGNNIPASGSGAIVVVDYQVTSPIIKYGESDTSIANYKVASKVIFDKAISDPRQAVSILQNQLALYSEPKVEGTLKVDGIATVTPGQTCVCNFPYEGINSEIFDILSASYNFDETTIFYDQVLTIKVGEKISNVIDQLKELALGVKRLQAADADDSAVVTRLKTGLGSFGFKVSQWIVQTHAIGSDFVLNHNLNSIIDSVGGTSLIYLPGSKVKTYTIQTSGIA